MLEKPYGWHGCLKTIQESDTRPELLEEHSGSGWSGGMPDKLWIFDIRLIMSTRSIAHIHFQLVDPLLLNLQDCPFQCNVL